MYATESLSPAERERMLLQHFRRLDDLGQNLALVLVQAIAGNPQLQTTRPEQPENPPEN